MLRIISILLAMLIIGCAAGQPKPPNMTVPETSNVGSSAASTPSMDERARSFFNTIAEGRTTIDQGTFLKYYRRRAAELARSGRVKMGQGEVAQNGTQLFRELDRNHDSNITEAELKFALQARERERKKQRHINPREWNLLDDAF